MIEMMNGGRFRAKSGIGVFALLCLIARLCLSPFELPAQADSPENSENAGGPDLEDLFGSTGEPSEPEPLRLFGEHGLRFPIAFFEGYQDFGSYTRAPRLENILGLEYETGPVKLRSVWHMDLSSNKLSQNESPASLSDLLDFRPGENYLAWAPGDWRLAFGLQEFSWGTADGLRPTDNLNPRSLRNSFDSVKLPIFAVDINWYPSREWQLELVLAAFTPDFELPEPVDKELQRRLVEESINAEVRLKPREFDWKNGQLGFRSVFYTEQLDFSLSYLFGLSPDYSVSKLELPSRLVELKRQSWRHIFGLDAKTNIGGLSLWAEAAYTLSPDYETGSEGLIRQNLSWILGIDFRYGPGRQIMTNLQIFGTWIPGYDGTRPESILDLTGYKRFLNHSLTGQNSGLELGLAANWSWDPGQPHFKFDLGLIYVLPLLYGGTEQTRYGGGILKPEIIYSPADAFEIYCALNLAYSWSADRNGTLQRDKTLRLSRNWYDSHVELGLRFAWDSSGF